MAKSSVEDLTAATPGETPVSGSNAQRRTNDGPPRKRSKILLACSPCRDRKIRCEGQRPVCSACGKKGRPEHCVYEESTLRTQRYFSKLESRLKELEGSNAGKGLNEPVNPESPDLVVQPPNPIDRENAAETRSCPSIPRRQDHSRNCEGTQGSSPHYNNDTVSDALNTIPSAQEDTEYMFGGSSSIAFIRQLRQTFPPHDVLGGASKSNGRGNIPRHKAFQGTEAARNLVTDTFVLPTRRVADDYMKCFWQYVHPVFPILHKPTFVTTYEILWKPEEERYPRGEFEDAEDPLFMSTLYIVFALGCQVCDKIAPAQKAALSDEFYQQSRKLVAIDALDSISLMVVQMLLLTSIYLQSTKYANRCWNIVGLAVRNAQSLGLHVENTRQSSTNQVRREIRRRVWYNCVIADKRLALTFGRPSMISNSWHVPPPIMVDDEYLLEDGDGCQPSHTKSHMGLFIHSIRLFEIMTEVVTTCYNQKEGKPPTGEVDFSWWSHHRLDDVLKLNRVLDQFLESLPSHLKVHGDGDIEGEKGNWTSLQAKILNYRFLYVRALLLRPILLSAAQLRKSPHWIAGDFANAKLEQQVAFRVCIMCVETVHALIADMCENLYILERSPICWHVHYTFSCAIVLIAADLCSFPDAQCRKDYLQASWSRCIEIFEHYKLHTPSASHAIRILESLREHINSPPDDPSSDSINLTHLERPASRQILDNRPNWMSLEGLEQFDTVNMDSLDEAWFAEQTVEINWLEGL